MTTGDDDEQLLKILIIGESAVGKSCLLLRYTDKKFSDAFMTTIGVDFKTKYLTIDGEEIKLQIWDTAGQEKFRAITKAYYRGANGILVVFDLTRPDTFLQTSMWIESIKDSTTDVIDVILVGNKSDLERKVSVEEAEETARQFGVKYFETSAREDKNINEAFDYLATKAYRRLKASENNQANQVIDKPVVINRQTEQKKKCC